MKLVQLKPETSAMFHLQELPVIDLASKLLTNENDALLLWAQLYSVGRLWRDFALSLRMSDVARPLYYAAFLNASKNVESILQGRRGSNIVRGIQYCKPFLGARRLPSSRGY